MACTRQQLNAFLDALLTPARFEDYCPNGLQVEGKEEVHHLVTGVTASQALLQAARERGADAILVHHGYFWRGEDPRTHWDESGEITHFGCRPNESLRVSPSSGLPS